MDSGVNLTVVTSLQCLHPPSFDWLLTFPSPISKRKPLPLSRGASRSPVQEGLLGTVGCFVETVDITKRKQIYPSLFLFSCGVI